MTLTFGSDHWRQQFDARGWNDFETLWEIEAAAVEPANVRRGGWSSVVRLETGDLGAFYLKRQENHDFTDWRQGFRRRATVEREWEIAATFRRFGVESAEGVCLGVDRSTSSRALLVTVALDDYQPLPAVLQTEKPAGAARKVLWQTIADTIRRIHDHGYRHNCLYGQHVYLKREADAWTVRLIDLEKATPTRRRRRATISDLSALDRHTDDMSHRDRAWLWDRYFEDVSLEDRRPILNALARRTSGRLVDQYLKDCAAGRRG
jgi:hypothetical protein